MDKGSSALFFFQGPDSPGLRRKITVCCWLWGREGKEVGGFLKEVGQPGLPQDRGGDSRVAWEVVLLFRTGPVGTQPCLPQGPGWKVGSDRDQGT